MPLGYGGALVAHGWVTDESCASVLPEIAESIHETLHHFCLEPISGVVDNLLAAGVVWDPPIPATRLMLDLCPSTYVYRLHQWTIAHSVPVPAVVHALCFTCLQMMHRCGFRAWTGPCAPPSAPPPQHPSLSPTRTISPQRPPAPPFQPSPPSAPHSLPAVATGAPLGAVLAAFCATVIACFCILRLRHFLPRSSRSPPVNATSVRVTVRDKCGSAEMSLESPIDAEMTSVAVRTV